MFYKYNRVSVRAFARCLFVYGAFIISYAAPGQLVSRKLSAADTGETIVTHEGKKNVLHFQYKPKSYNGQYERAGYVHPLYGLNGEILTEDMPEDHPYHRGIFWAWHQVLRDEKKVADGWISENILWKPGKMDIEKGPGFIRLCADIYWRLITNKDTISLLKERTVITVFVQKRNTRVIDFDITLLPVVTNVSIGGAENEKGYGGFCLRLRLPSDIRFNSEDIDIIPQENAVKAGEWMDFTGSFAGSNMQKAGIVVMTQHDPQSDRRLWILRNQKSMQNIVDPGNSPVRIPDAGWHRKYRLVIHDGTLNTERINGLMKAFKNKK